MKFGRVSFVRKRKMSEAGEIEERVSEVVVQENTTAKRKPKLTKEAYRSYFLR